MSTLNGNSTTPQVKASFDDNASYAEDNSLAKAKAFKTAVIILMRRSLKKSRVGGGAAGEEFEIDHETLRRLYDEVTAWITANPSTSGSGGARYFSLQNSRD